ncbi:flagellar biosynthesis protein FlgE [Methylosinus sp. R-45379]|jgi:flagellar hook protein FlgE|uniref:flagellar hook protein FlgE n=1 Tax=unclassified Methylosinus TaxID=2624500 RepID=UPI000467AC49|nr:MULTISPECIES: flagellar hook protein FlgE [unclassified Methylosinus]OAI29607.1 flagellar biosynthesis protein FlgE [Methylosinus sp. R-45379]TDX65853.1 flagellar hook protein FlgE [Methylosinus sp. sav-2]
MTASALFNTSVMGMSAQTTALSAVAENISNSNTVGYKEATTQFQTLLTSYQGGNNADGGVSASNVIEVTKSGSTLTTTSATDLAIQGDGFFVVSDAAGNTYLTRAGSFLPDSQGRLVNTAGYYLMGYSSSAASAPTDPSELSTVTIPYGKEIGTASTEGSLTANLPSTADVIAAADLPSANSSTSTYTDKTSVTAYDNLGNAVTLDVYFSKTSSNNWEMSVYNAADATSGGFPYSSGPLTTQSLTFSATDGSISSGSSASIAVPDGSTLALDLSGLTQLGSSFSVSNPTINGNAASQVSSVSIAKDGTLSYVLGNGQSVSAYKIPLGTVASPSNLQALSGNTFAVTKESGAAYLGDANSGSMGAIASDQLEGSTVDLATQLSNMIVAQRSFSANSQVFQVASEVMQVLNNLK